jgi:exodeoxyribonuclease VII small subunit
MTAKRDNQSFEELYRRLEETVDKLEKGGLPLEESIALYEEGMELAKRCQAVLDGAELRITKLRESFAQPGGAAAQLGDEPEPLELEEE